LVVEINAVSGSPENRAGGLAYNVTEGVDSESATPIDFAEKIREILYPATIPTESSSVPRELYLKTDFDHVAVPFF
jgi:hypothetical protein